MGKTVKLFWHRTCGGCKSCGCQKKYKKGIGETEAILLGLLLFILIQQIMGMGGGGGGGGGGVPGIPGGRKKRSLHLSKEKVG